MFDTPREAITTAALLRLPPSVPRAAKLAKVEELLELLVGYIIYYIISPKLYSRHYIISPDASTAGHPYFPGPCHMCSRSCAESCAGSYSNPQN